MKRLLLTILLALLGAGSVFAQSTTVSGTITDSGGQAWANGTFQFVFVPNPSYPSSTYTWTGGALPTNITGTINSGGGYSVSIPSTTAISPVGSAWKATFCPLATWPCYQTQIFTVQGATQTVAPTPPAIAINLINPPSGIVRAYGDSEIVSAVIASLYYNLSSQTYRGCQAVTVQTCTLWTDIGSGGGGGGSPGSPTNSFQWNQAGSFGGSLFNYVPSSTDCDAGNCPAIESTVDSALTFNATDGNGFIQAQSSSDSTGGGESTIEVDNYLTLSPFAEGYITWDNIGGTTAGPGGCFLFYAGTGSPPCAVGFLAAVGDNGANGANGQDATAFAASLQMNKASGSMHNLAGLVVATPVKCPTPGTCITNPPAPTETAANIYGVEIQNLKGLGSTETAALHVEAQTGGGNSLLVEAGGGKAVLAASNTTNAGFNLPQGVAPTSPVNGDLWSTSGGFYGQINGATIGPFLDQSTLPADLMYTDHANSVTGSITPSGAGTVQATSLNTPTNPTGYIGTASYGGTLQLNPLGLGLGNGGADVTTCSPYIIQGDTSTGTVDRGTLVEVNTAGACAVTLPDPTSTGPMGKHFVFKITQIGAGALTVTRQTSATMTINNGASSTSGATSFVLQQGQFASVYAADNANWRVDEIVSSGAGNTTSTSLTTNHLSKANGANSIVDSSLVDNGSTVTTTEPLLVSGIVDGQAPVTVTTGSTATLGGTYSSGYTFNQNATAATAITYTLPTAAAGKQYCVKNSYNGSAGNTGTLELLTSAAGQYIISAGVLSATGGYVISSGALGDAACVVGVDSTHWSLYISSGTWTLH